MTLDVAMGGSTNTVLHLLAAAQEAGVDFTMAGHRPPLAQGAACARWRRCRKYHIEDVHRAGGIMAFWANWPRRPAAHRRAHRAHPQPWAKRSTWDIMHRRPDARARILQAPRPGGVPTQTAFSQSTRWPELDTDRTHGCIRSTRKRLLARKAVLPCSTATSRAKAAS
jgi:dihydroxy-acid dehydratase